MWWRRTVLGVALISLLGLAACGYQPLYATRHADRAVPTELAAIFVETIPGRDGQLFRNHLKRRLTPRGSRAARYLLSITLAEAEESYLVRSDEIATRIDLVQSARYRLIDCESRRDLATGTAARRVGFNLADAEYAAVINQRNARELGLKQLADDVVMRLSTHFANPAARAATQ